jgi:hypothetical protein
LRKQVSTSASSVATTVGYWASIIRPPVVLSTLFAFFVTIKNRVTREKVDVVNYTTVQIGQTTNKTVIRL